MNQLLMLQDKAKDFERELGEFRKKLGELEADSAAGVSGAQDGVGRQQSLYGTVLASQGFQRQRTLILDKCPDPSNLKDEFRSLLQVKHKNRKQLIFGPVISKQPGDGFLEKDKLVALADTDVDAAIQAIGVEGTYNIIVTNAEKRMARVRFEGPLAETSCEKILSSWKLLRDDYKMWAGPDQPAVDLSKMVVNAKKFGIALRTVAALPANSYVDVKDGVLFIGSIRIAPVYLIPEPEKWTLIQNIVLDEIKAILSKPWVTRKVCPGSLGLVDKIWDAAWKNEIG
jgi:hypothetical protein